jgi:hypothetical protein
MTSGRRDPARARVAPSTASTARCCATLSSAYDRDAIGGSMRFSATAVRASSFHRTLASLGDAGVARLVAPIASLEARGADGAVITSPPHAAMVTPARSAGASREYRMCLIFCAR